jgi:hypothetical protein
MRRIPLFVITILAISFGWCLNAEANDRSLHPAENQIAAPSALASTVARYDLHLNPDLRLAEVSSFDYAKCMESCDNQYSACTKNADAEKIKYCSNQHDRCRNACLEHK